VKARAFAGESDAARIVALAYADAANSPHLLDLPYRLCAPALYVDPARDTRLWEDDDGELIACAAWQQPFATLDYALHPRTRGTFLAERLLAWATLRFAEMGQERGVRLPYWFDLLPIQADRIALLRRHHYARRKGWQLLHLTRPLDTPIAAPELPPGFTLRPLAGAAEIPAYVAAQHAAFESTNMTGAWRERTLRAPGYRPDLDLVIAAPGGRLAAFGIGWTTPVEQRQVHGFHGQIEPLGVHPDFQHLGLGRAILLAALGRLREAGVSVAHIDVYSDNEAARGLYEGVGFSVAYTIEKWFQEF
jgi:mycothiol synthase